jgi:hypothetical protein
MRLRRIIFCLVLCLGLTGVLLLGSDFTTRAQPSEKHIWDTGAVSLGPNQVLRITVTHSLQVNTSPIEFRIGRTIYTPGGCNPDGVCKLIGTNTYTGPTTLLAGQAATYDALVATTYGRGTVISNSRNLQVRASIVDGTTGDVQSLMALLLP